MPRHSHHRLLLGGVAAMLIVALSWSWLSADFEMGAGLDGPETIETLTVRLTVGAEGEDLSEPVALDLGLGFPLWLQPVGRVEGETLPFGAVAQESDAGETVPAGGTATFTFDVAGGPGQDALQTTSQLLQDVRLSDISRIGFMSQGRSNWTLTEYEIQVNGRVFAANDTVNLGVQDAQEAAVFRLAELNLEIEPLEAEAVDLQALAEAGLATEDDLLRLDEVEGLLQPLEAERERVTAQQHGTYPWFEEPAFVSPWREVAPVASLRVTVDTDVHPMAETENFVYFRTGGHKYLIGSPENPLTGEFGPQEFEIDLLGGPLTAADLRGYALGMLGHGGLSSEAPDRWHPRRLLVEIDGSIVYDSESSDVDRMSLGAIRIIPPAHVGPAAEVITNEPSERETYVWHAGSGAGLDLVDGGVADLPEEDDPLYPDPEEGVDDWPPVDDGWVVDDDLFPGEYWPGWDPGWHPGWGPGWDPGWGPGWGPGLGPDVPWWPGPPDLADMLWWWFLDDTFADLLDEVDPFGEPFSITNVRIADGWRENEPFTVEWDVVGDASSIESFTVELLPVHPHDDPFMLPGVVATRTGIDPGARHDHLVVPVMADPELYVRPLVTGLSSRLLIPDDADFGPARPLFPETATEDMMPPAVTWSGYHDAGGTSHDQPMELAGIPAPAGRSIWSFPGGPGHSDLEFGDPRPGRNFAFRTEPGDQFMGVIMEGGVVEGHFRVLANVGFLGEPDPANTADFFLLYYVAHPAPAGDLDFVSVPVTVTAGIPQPMPLIDLDFDTATLGAGPCELTVVVGVGDPSAAGSPTGSDDFDHPPAVFGLRVVPVP